MALPKLYTLSLISQLPLGCSNTAWKVGEEKDCSVVDLKTRISFSKELAAGIVALALGLAWGIALIEMEVRGPSLGFPSPPA